MSQIVHPPPPFLIRLFFKNSSNIEKQADPSILTVNWTKISKKRCNWLMEVSENCDFSWTVWTNVKLHCRPNRISSLIGRLVVPCIVLTCEITRRLLPPVTIPHNTQDSLPPPKKKKVWRPRFTKKTLNLEKYKNKNEMKMVRKVVDKLYQVKFRSNN